MTNRRHWQDVVGITADNLDTALYTNTLPMPAQINALRRACIKAHDELRSIVREYSDEDPWADEPPSFTE